MGRPLRNVPAPALPKASTDLTVARAAAGRFAYPPWACFDGCMAEEAHEHTVVSAPPGRCWGVATDYESYPEWARDVKQVDLLERDAEGDRLEPGIIFQPLGDIELDLYSLGRAGDP